MMIASVNSRNWKNGVIPVTIQPRAPVIAEEPGDTLFHVPQARGGGVVHGVHHQLARGHFGGDGPRRQRDGVAEDHHGAGVGQLVLYRTSFGSIGSAGWRIR